MQSGNSICGLRSLSDLTAIVGTIEQKDFFRKETIKQAIGVAEACIAEINVFKLAKDTVADNSEIKDFWIGKRNEWKAQFERLEKSEDP